MLLIETCCPAQVTLTVFHDMFGFTLHDDVDDIELFIFWRLRSISEGISLDPAGKLKSSISGIPATSLKDLQNADLSTGHAFQWRRSVANKGD